MKELYCYSDIGSCLIGDKNWTFAVPNIGGDGRTKIITFNKDGKEFAEYCKNHKLNFISSVQGTFNIYSYDCAFVYFDDCAITEPNDEVIETLTGRYGVYNSYMTVVFVKWE